MRLGVKHQNQFQIVHADFSGGLNTSTSVDGIAENQLARATNVEVDHATGKLKTVAGTIDVLKFENLLGAAYDDINRKLLLFDADKKVYAFDFKANTTSDELGTLSGELYPICTSWEDGLLIASGGKLQYFNGAELVTLNSPTATSVCIQAGRVLVTDTNNLYLSSIGDETNWIEDANIDSSAKFLEIGYKDGGELVCMVSLPSGVLLVKNNRRAYRFNIGFPSWSLVEVSRNVEMSGRLSICAVADSIFTLGRDEVQNIQASNVYGNAKPQNIAILIESEIKKVTENSLVRYVPKLNQIWILNGEAVLMYDLVTQSWYKRQFNSQILDVISVDDEVFVIKPDRVSKLDEKVFHDSEEELTWDFKCKRRISHYDYLLKNTVVSFTPIDMELTSGVISAGKVKVKLSLNENGSSTRRRLISDEEQSNPTVLAQNRNVYRNKFLDIEGRGTSGGIIFNSIVLDVVEI
ncbi:MAG: hypothetical protein IJK81_13365 [Selenomonadaceae bacterium]|nr:hypothetical protein [Selenomonadaceae bacterium]